MQLTIMSYQTVLIVLFGILVLVDCQAAQSQTASHCQYLSNSPSRWAPNAGPFRLYTRSRARNITPGKPVEVTIGPFSPRLNIFNFTDFILYATPVIRSGMEMEYWPGMSSTTKKPHLGVFQIFEKWAAGAGPLNCNPRSRVDDSVGAFEERLLDTYRQYYPNNPMLNNYQPPARNQVAVLWWPTKDALAYPEIRFEAKVKSMGNWFTIHSTSWPVNRPVDQWAMTEQMLTQFQTMQSNMKAMERRMDQPGI